MDCDSGTVSWCLPLRLGPTKLHFPDFWDPAVMITAARTAWASVCAAAGMPGEKLNAATSEHARLGASPACLRVQVISNLYVTCIHSTYNK